MKIFPEFIDQLELIKAIRRDIHAHPELKFTEFRTSELIAKQLKSWGIQTHVGLGKTGVVGTIQGNLGPGKSIGLRADIDALPLQEHNAFAHASQHEGKMHACGHDGHTAMLLSAAQFFASHREFKGTVHFIFQPAEEGGGGAREMMADGLFTLFPCDAVFGMHNWPGMPEGSFGVIPGPMMASSNEFTITIKGKGAHAALPHNGADPVFAIAQLASSLQSIITRNKKPVDTAVLSITQIHAGFASNVIPNDGWLGGTIRTFTNPVLDLLEQRLRDIAHGTSLAFNCTAEVEFERNYPPLINHLQETAFAQSVIKNSFGDAQFIEGIEPTMGSEDFAFMLEKVPGCYVFIGNGDGDHRAVGHGMGPCHLHNPCYDFNDHLLPVGASYWVHLTQAYLT
ncbi:MULTISPECIES: M20 aminoacylase family protein [unclassified Polynucleobacter]|uniref:M20 aminoacylase family protein n=1 Tax=unclassified Polynucleobacter TaxID=2640945 RepID=UPI0024921861|nr:MULTISPECIES: M20 aminoacylase family protein [unclassified Polynucleobacter]